MREETLSESVMDTLHRINNSYGRGTIHSIWCDKVGNYSALINLQHGNELARITLLSMSFVRFRGQKRKIKSNEEFYRNR